MERQASIDRKRRLVPSNSFPNQILQLVVNYDPKLDFTCVPIAIDEEFYESSIRQQTYGLIWNSVRSSNTSRLISYDRLNAFVEILQIPSEWSRYDIDLLIHKNRNHKLLNGLALRDEFVRVLHRVFQQDPSQMNDSYVLKHLEFTRRAIQLTFHHRQDTELPLIITFLLLIELNIPWTTFFPNEYFQSHADIKSTYLSPSNSIKFQFDSSVIEANLCHYLIDTSESFSSIFKSLIELRKQSLNYIQRAVRYVSKTRDEQTSSDQINPSISAKIEGVLSSLFCTSSLQTLFLILCSNYSQIESISSPIVNALQILINALENNYLEHPLLKTKNIFSEMFSLCDVSLQYGIKKLLVDMQINSKRGMRR
ncbi:unnamed protein product [Adineta ricciae]|uniref:Uncharacterized protein n=1 Tax=Adineta ricciae TaxID=249248 RepID=A0A814I4R8_ADIRI|nr:unnamed protein product [Adineta ricciae]CAF1017084.1 unnamed protein product [Adineta ricciae]